MIMFKKNGTLARHSCERPLIKFSPASQLQFEIPCSDANMIISHEAKNGNSLDCCF